MRLNTEKEVKTNSMIEERQRVREGDGKKNFSLSQGKRGRLSEKKSRLSYEDENYDCKV